VNEKAVKDLKVLQVVEAGRVPYGAALEWQRELAAARVARRLDHDVLLLLEHPPVVTQGRRARAENLLATAEALRARGIELHQVNRGGDVTYHGPGQLVGYLVADLRAPEGPDVHRHLRRIEAALGRALAELGVASHVREGMTGVFAGASGELPPRKIASIGVGLRGWVTWHGFALNVSCGPDAFADIVPCGLHGVVMTSVREERGAAQDASALLAEACEQVARAARRHLAGPAAIG
jgi:lipoate-protein ligase B